MKPVRSLDLGTFRIILENTTLDDVIVQIGPGSSWSGRRPEDHDEATELCYETRDGFVNFISDWEMGGPERDITEIALQKHSPPNHQSCPHISRRFEPVLLNGVVHLGMSRKVTYALFGPGTLAPEHWVKYSYMGKRPGKCDPDGFDVINWLQIRFEGSAVAEIRAGQVTTC